MKKMSVLLMVCVLSACGKDVKLSDVFDNSPMNPPVIEQANAKMMSAEATVTVSDSDCEAGTCRVTAFFLNQGGKVAHDLQYKFKVDSDEINGVSIDAADETTEPSSATKVIFNVSYYPSISLGKMGFIELDYAMNAKGERQKVIVDVIKIH